MSCVSLAKKLLEDQNEFRPGIKIALPFHSKPKTIKSKENEEPIGAEAPAIVNRRLVFYEAPNKEDSRSISPYSSCGTINSFRDYNKYYSGKSVEERMSDFERALKENSLDVKISAILRDAAAYSTGESEKSSRTDLHSKYYRSTGRSTNNNDSSEFANEKSSCEITFDESTKSFLFHNQKILKESTGSRQNVGSDKMNDNSLANSNRNWHSTENTARFSEVPRETNRELAVEQADDDMEVQMLYGHGHEEEQFYEDNGVPSLYFKEIISCLRDKNYEGAKSLLKQKIEETLGHNQGNPSQKTNTLGFCLYLISICCFKRGEFAEGIMCASKGIDLYELCSPESIRFILPLRCIKGKLLMCQGKHEEALACLSQALNRIEFLHVSEKNDRFITKKKFYIGIQIVSCYFELKRVKEGVKIAEDIIVELLERGKYHELFSKWLFISEIMHKQQLYQEAIELFEKLVLLKGEITENEKNLEKLREHKEKFIDLINMKSLIVSRMNFSELEIKESLVNLDFFLIIEGQRSEKYANCCLKHGELLLKFNDLKHAKSWVHKGLTVINTLFGRDSERTIHYWLLLAKVNYLSSKLDETILCLELAASLYKNNLSLRPSVLGKIYVFLIKIFLTQKEESQEYLNKYEHLLKEDVFPRNATKENILVCLELGLNYQENANTERAIYYYSYLLNLYHDKELHHGNKPTSEEPVHLHAFFALKNMGKCLCLLRKYEKALGNYQQALQLAPLLNNRAELAYLYKDISYIYELTSKPLLAKSFLSKYRKLTAQNLK